MRSIALLVALLALAGCVAPGGDEAPPTTPTSLTHDADGCTLVVAAALVEPATAQAALPDGFVVADAQGLVGAPAATGRAAVLVTSYRCETAASVNGTLVGGEVNVLIEPPEVDGVNSTADTHYYQLALYAPAGSLVNTLVSVGWPVHVADPEAEVSSFPAGGATASGSVSDANGSIYTLSAGGLAPSTLAGTSRFWADVPQGAAYWDYTVDAEVFAGAGSCVLAASTPAADAIGASACPSESVGIVVPSFSWTSVLRHEPDARVLPQR